MTDETPIKSLFASRTLIVNTLIGLAALNPTVAAFVSSNPQVVLYGLIAVNYLLRLITKSKLQLFAK